MDLNNENFDEDVQLNKAEEMLVWVVSAIIVGLPVVTILKIKVYDVYAPVVKNYLFNLF